MPATDDRNDPRALAAQLEQLRRSEERYRLLIEDVPGYAIFMLDPEGNVSTWNAGAQKLTGYSAERILGRNFSVFFTDADRLAGHPGAELQLARTDGRFEKEAWRLREDGTQFWASAVVSPLRDSAGGLVGFSKITRDLTERKVAEDTAAALREQQLARAVAEASEARAKEERERYRLLSRQLEVILEGVVDGITVQDRSGKVVFANRAAALRMGFASKEELLEEPPGELRSRFDLFDEHGSPFPREQLPGRRVLAGAPQASALVLTRDRHLGVEWWCQVRASGVADDAGVPELAVNIWHDVSQQRRRDEQDRLLNDVSTVLGKSLDYDVTLNAFVRLLAPSLGARCAIHALEGSQLRLVAAAQAAPPPHRYGVEQPGGELDLADPNGVWQVIRTGRPQLESGRKDPGPEEERREGSSRSRDAGLHSRLLVPIQRRDGVSEVLSLVAADSGRRYDDSDLVLALELGRRVGAFIENALLFQRATAAAVRAEEAAREAEAAGRMKDEFLATVSHELRTPLNAILGWSSLLKTRTDPASLAKGVDVIHRNAQSQSKIIEDILDVSRIITGKLRLEPKQVDLGAVVLDALEAVRPSAHAREVRLELERPSEPVLLSGDPERMQQVMWNLLSNAVKFTERGGHVRVTLERGPSQLLVTVKDDGKGIDPEFMPYVFERFKQADSSTTRRFGGLGLGLAIVRHIVELHGGRASVSSPGPGLGSTFRIVLPLRAEPPAATAPPSHPGPSPVAPPAAPPRLAGVRVLVVEDQADTRELLHLVLTEAGAEVQTAASATDAFTKLSAHAPHVVVSDIGLPDEDGYALMRRIREAGDGVPTVALTAYTRPEDRARALRMGFSAYVGKPVDPTELLDLLAALAGRPRP